MELNDILHRLNQLKNNGFFIRILNLKNVNWCCGIRTHIDHSTIGYGSSTEMIKAMEIAIKDFDMKMSDNNKKEENQRVCGICLYSYVLCDCAKTGRR